MAAAGARARFGLTLRAILALLVLLAVSAPVLGALGALDEIEWHDDFVTGVQTSVAILTAVASGFVVARWRALLLVWVLAMAWVVIEQLRWQDDPRLSGLDDLSPFFLLPFTPLAFLLAAVGVGLARLVDQANH